MSEPKLRRLLAALITAALALSVTIVVTDNGPDHEPGQPRRTVTVTLGGPGHEKIALTPAAQAQVAQQAKEDAAGQDAKAESDLHEARQPSSAALEQARGRAPPGARTDPAGHDVREPVDRRAAPARSCATTPAGPPARASCSASSTGPARARSPTHRRRPRDRPLVRHPRRAGQLELHHRRRRPLLLRRPRIPERRGRRPAFNPWAVSDEHINAGVLPVFPTAAGRDAVVRLMRGWHERWKIPYQRGLVRGCTVIRPGFLAHRDLGPCGGGHPDIGIPSAVDELIRLAAAGDHPVTSVDRVTCRKLNAYRRDRDHGARISAHRGHINATRRRALAARGITCTARGPIRR
jgi:hypothetical protein